MEIYVSDEVKDTAEVDPEPWVDDCFGGRWSTEKMNAYKSHGSSFTFAFQPRY